ncbi:ABC transporter permease [Acidisphaera sp. L21]|uniref:ABC transporter permease n=1 Tax=Acidisphaera sp. L21 TaxID=1641851 RepID=UPI00131C3D42|nr:ABC transporter permease [Acidisphaera sp. L21]
MAAASPAGFDPRLAWPLGSFLALLFAVPLAMLLVISLQTGDGYGFGQYAKFLTDWFSLRILGGTLRLGVEVTIACLVLGFPLAWLHARSPGWAKSAITLVVLLPLLTSVVVRTFAWIVILGRQGIINNALVGAGLIDTPLRLLYTEGGVVAALAQVQMPLMVLPLVAALGRADPNLADAASILGAGAWRTWRTVVLPLAMPGIIAGCLLTFTASVTAFITQSLVGGGQMMFMPAYVLQQAIALGDMPFAAAISVIFLVCVLIVVALLSLLGRRSRAHV